MADHGIDMIAAGLDRYRLPQRILDTGRYRAMQAYFDATGWAGRTMMCNTASMQINVGIDGDPVDAWRAAHLVADVLGRQHAGPCPNRANVWSRIDTTRTAAVGGTDPRDAWATYAMNARVMFIRTSAEDCVPVLEGMTLCDWLERGNDLGWPTEADVLEHLTTLFPPVRPRGFLELRTLDALDDDRWPAVAEMAVSLLLDGPARRELLEHACR
jgi:glutamate--cysteine ligase